MARNTKDFVTVAISKENKATLNFIRGTNNLKTFDDALTYLIEMKEEGLQHDAIEFHTRKQID